MIDAEGPCGGARQAARDTVAPQGAARAARAKDARRSGAARHCRDIGVTGATHIQHAALWPGPARGGSGRHWPAFFRVALLRPGSPRARRHPHPRAPFSPCSSVGVRCVSAFLCFGITRCDRGGPLKSLLRLTCWQSVWGVHPHAGRGLTALSLPLAQAVAVLTGLPASDSPLARPARPGPVLSLEENFFVHVLATYSIFFKADLGLVFVFLLFIQPDTLRLLISVTVFNRIVEILRLGSPVVPFAFCCLFWFLLLRSRFPAFFWII